MSRLLEQIPSSWRPVLAPEAQKPYWRDLEAFLDEERASHRVFPPAEDVFSALAFTPFESVRVVLLGQDPYHDDGQAHGLCFSVRRGIKPPPSLVNIFAELQSDLGFPPPRHGCLEHWARQGVLLLNTVLTVRAHEAASHKGRGWEVFTDAILRSVIARTDTVVFVLWGAHAQKKAKLLDGSSHVVLQSAHPSPLSARNGFFGSRPFSKINRALKAVGRGEIDWHIPDDEKRLP